MPLRVENLTKNLLKTHPVADRSFERNKGTICGFASLNGTILSSVDAYGKPLPEEVRTA